MNISHNISPGIVAQHRLNVVYIYIEREMSLSSLMLDASGSEIRQLQCTSSARKKHDVLCVDGVRIRTTPGRIEYNKRVPFTRGISASSIERLIEDGYSCRFYSGLLMLILITQVHNLLRQKSIYTYA